MAESRQHKQDGQQLELSFTPGAEGEALSGIGGRVEAASSTHRHESPTESCGSVMQEVLSAENLRAAWKQVQANKGSPGIDGMTVEELPCYLKAHWSGIREAILQGRYRPQPVKRVLIPKPDGGVRKLGIPTVLDRFIQQAVLLVLQKRWDHTFSQSSYGFRPGRSAHQAVEAAQRHIASGRCWVVDIDLEKFFDRVNHDRLMSRIMQRENDKALITLIRAYLNAGVMENGVVVASEEGTPQGGPLSPLLSNLVLDELDKELEKRGHAFVRYADDCNIYVASERAGQRVMEGVSRLITERLKLKVNASKSAVDRPSKRKFLGFSFTGFGREPKRRVAPKALTRFKEKVRDLTRRTRGQSLRQLKQPLNLYLRGWRGYFGFCQTPSVLKSLDEWIRRRLRCVAWKQWKRGSRRFAELTKRGVSKDLAAQSAGSCHGPWRLSKSPALSIALPNRLWDLLGIERVFVTR
jgi:RNA-directed DNA polymerase